MRNRYCKNAEEIENYELAKKDNFEGWHCHHRLEIMPFSGKIVSQKYLIEQGLYYNVQPSALIYMKAHEHRCLQNANKGRKREDLSEYNKKNKKGQTPWNKGLHYKNDNISRALKGKTSCNKGKHWYNNGIINIMAFECPEGFTKGHIVSNLQQI